MIASLLTCEQIVIGVLCTRDRTIMHIVYITVHSTIQGYSLFFHQMELLIFSILQLMNFRTIIFIPMVVGISCDQLFYSARPAASIHVTCVPP